VHKSLIDVGGKPLLSRTLHNLRTLNPEKIVIITNDKFYEQFVEWNDKHSENVILINDGTKSNEERLGTIKDVLLGLDNHDSDFMIYLGDNLFIGDLTKPYKKFSEQHKSIIMLRDLKNLEEAKKFGVVKIDNSERISHMEEKPSSPKSTLISTGIYFMTPDIKEAMREYSSKGINIDAFGHFLGNTYNDMEYYGYILDDSFEWIDIGSPESLEKAKKLFSNS
jgi:glucose-1-phosphate thymidylyltransferase